MTARAQVRPASVSSPVHPPTLPSRFLLQRKCACGNAAEGAGECEGCRRKRRGLHRKASGAGQAPTRVPPVVGQVLQAPGRPLDADDLAYMEPRFGRSFAHVRVHTDARAAESALAIDAQAYTSGHHIVFGSGRTPRSDGRRLLAHELAHVVQQERGGNLPRSGVTAADAPSERQADAIAARVTQAAAGVRPAADGSNAPDDGAWARAARPGGRALPDPGSAGSAHGVRQTVASPVDRLLVQRRRQRSTASSAPRLDFQPSANGEPCACLVFIHNNERNARLTAQLMHRHCSYNLAIMEPDDGQRHIRLPGGSGSLDPNELFPRDIAEQCLSDPQQCRDHLTANAGATGRAEVEGYVQRQFFLAIHDCSSGFTLPVVALHNNAINDTARYRARMGSAATGGVQRGTFEQEPAAPTTDAQPEHDDPVRPIQELRDWLRDNFDTGTVDALTGRRGTTNIFRWCVSPDISRCHVGDPEHPDTVVWVTNEADFDRLSTENVNVVLQAAASATGESATDLSTLFLTVQDLIRGQFAPAISRLQEGAEVEIGTIREILAELETMREYGDLTPGNTLPRLFDALRAFGRLLVRLLEWALANGAQAVRLAQVRYLNIETPGSATSRGQTPGQLREASYDAIVTTLRAVGLHCCGEESAAAEERVREGLRRGTLEPPSG